MRSDEFSPHPDNETSLKENIAQMIGRPANNGHIGEYIAANIFEITFEESATNRGSDGYFASGPLVGKSVNVKLYAKRTNILDINPSALPDYFLVLTGPKAPAASSKGTVAPLCVTTVFLFHARKLVGQLKGKIGIATSVPQAFWDKTEIFPRPNNPELVVSPTQKEIHKTFSDVHSRLPEIVIRQ